MFLSFHSFNKKRCDWFNSILTLIGLIRSVVIRCFSATVIGLINESSILISSLFSSILITTLYDVYDMEFSELLVILGNFQNVFA